MRLEPAWQLQRLRTSQVAVYSHLNHCYRVWASFIDIVQFDSHQHPTEIRKKLYGAFHQRTRRLGTAGHRHRHRTTVAYYTLCACLKNFRESHPALLSPTSTDLKPTVVLSNINLSMSRCVSHVRVCFCLPK